MTWREEAKELGIKMYQRKKEDVLKDIEAMNKRDSIFIDAMIPAEPESIIIDTREANEICKQALIDHVTAMGLINVSIEGGVDSRIRKKRFLNCKRRGIAFKGTRDAKTDDSVTEGSDKTEASGSEGTGTDVSGSITEQERGDSSEGIEQDVQRE